MAAKLKNKEAHLWLIDPAKANGRKLSALMGLLDRKERRRLQRFKHEKSRHLFLVSHIFLRPILSRYLRISPGKLRFKTNSHGKPFLNGNAVIRRLNFNLSHTHDLIVIAVGWDREIGVDVERLDRIVEPLALGKRFFSAQETAALRKAQASRRPALFSLYWTLKEAYVKACGKGFAVPLCHFTMHPKANGTARISLDAKREDAPEKWRFFTCKPDPKHIVSVCVSSPGGKDACKLHFHKFS